MKKQMECKVFNGKKKKVWGKLITSAYCEVDKLPPHLVEVELDEKTLDEIYTFMKVHKENGILLE